VLRRDLRALLTVRPPAPLPPQVHTCLDAIAGGGMAPGVATCPDRRLGRTVRFCRYRLHGCAFIFEALSGYDTARFSREL